MQRSLKNAVFGTGQTDHGADDIRKIPELLSQQVVGQRHLIDRLLIGLLCGGHLLLEGFPGLAKTRSVKELASYIQGEFHRIQFTPDLLPADLTGTDIYRPEKGTFEFQKGPLFHEIILADEINRAPAKVQSALLEAMEERQITVGNQTYRLPDLFMVLATQNPIEHEGTYPLPEAQRDRFLMQVRVGYPDKDQEQGILRIARSEAIGDRTDTPTDMLQVTHSSIVAARAQIYEVHMEPMVEQYIIELIDASRNVERYDADLARWIQIGSSPRGTIALDVCSRARAWVDGRDYVSPADVQQVALDVLRHRLLLTFEADAENVDVDEVIQKLIAVVAVP
ncbi:MAG: AAA family ATPase [Acidiferrobacterales bacterium]|nr:AAA family ATPase [Acidiferrobacterales bacterium]